MNYTQSKLSKSIVTILFSITTPLLITACGGGDNSTSGKIKKEYQQVEKKVSNVANDIKEEYQAFEDKLSDEEKNMAKILESVFLPEETEENFEEFLDKLTPEGGKGGLYVGNFVESNDGDSNDIDIGAIYFDISKDFGGSINGRVSYQQKACQANRTLSTDNAIKVDNGITGKLSGSLDSLELLDVKYIRDLGIETPNILTTFYGQLKDDVAGSPWAGSFEYQDGLGGTQLSAGTDSCNVSYTIGDQSDFTAYPLDYKLGNLDLNITGTGSVTTLNWTNPDNVTLVLVSQINVNEANTGANGFERNQIFINGEQQYTPVMTEVSKNYAFVVQAFDNDNKLIGYSALIIDLPSAR